MAKTHQEQQQPLLRSPPSNSSCKTTALFAALTLLTLLICSIALLSTLPSTTISNNISFSPSHVCVQARDRDSCLALLTPLVSPGNVVKSMSEVQVLELFLNNSISPITDTIKLTGSVSSRANDVRQKSALADCVDLMESSIDRVFDSISALTSGQHQLSDVHTWLSSVLTNYVTCSDGLDGSTAGLELKAHLEDLTVRASTSLAILTTMMKSKQNNLHDMISKPLYGEFPSWITPKDRKILLGEVTNPAMNADIVVAKDGSGKYKTVKEAIAAAPANSKTRYVIYVKKGTYKENVEIPKTKKNLMLTGDGMDSTVITGSLNVVDGSTTFNSATLIVSGEGFIAQDLWIQNTAGPEKHQAVALRVSADQSVINRCRLDAYQDTLYTHSLRQFYRDCTVTGTVDFIFGNAAVVFQKCKLLPRKPMGGQGNMVTAQGRTDPNQNTGISIQNCDIIASSDLEPVKKSFKSYLGRPWKEYSRTVVMQSNIGDVIDPTGWSAWSGDFALKTLYYGEYMNRGAGAGTSKRVNWPGYRVITSAAEAGKFTVASLIQGGVWLKSSGVAYTEGL